MAGRVRRSLAAGCGLACLAVVLPAAPGAAPSPEPALLHLSPGADVERALAAGEVQAFAADLAAGEPCLVAAEQRGIDLVLEVRRADGASLAAVDGPLDRWGTEVLLLHPEAAGSYRIEVRSEQQGVGSGSYSLRLEPVPVATPAERERAAGLAAATAGGALLHRQAPGAADQASAAYEEARGHFRAAGDRRGEAEAVNALAALAHRRGRRRQAADLYRDSAVRWRELQQPAREVRAWNDLGLTWWELGDLPAAESALASGLALARELDEDAETSRKMQAV